jgi:multidrug efflux pump subunit AcrB
MRERASIDTLRDLQLIGSSGQSVPLGALANVRYEMEQPTIWRRSRLPTITLKASIADSTQAKTVVDLLVDVPVQIDHVVVRDRDGIHVATPRQFIVFGRC